ncbi:hypothetical protein AcV7_005523 [Taiwanofungus camphoratus]|nr:hypothetical protein AcV7_005523 [Antrodia cinnamomea]
MSARTPFVPQRPASARPTSNQSEPDSVPVAISQPPDPFRSNGLLLGPREGLLLESSDTANSVNDQANPQQKSPSSTEAYTMIIMNSNNKPLNLSGLTKKKHPPQQSTDAPEKSRKVLEEAATRARSPNPFQPNQQALRIMTPCPSSPFFPNTSSLVSTNAFRKPAPLISSKLQSAVSADDLSSNSLHTSSLTPASAVVPHTVTQSHERAPLPSPTYDTARLTSPRLAVSHSSLEEIHEVTEEGESSGACAIFDGRTHRNDNHGQCGTVSDYAEEQTQFITSTGYEEREQRNLRRLTKRIQRPDEDEEKAEYGSEAKRYKGDQNDFSAIYSRQITPAMHFPLQGQAGRVDKCHSMPLYGYTSGAQALYADRPEQQLDDSGHAVHKLLGQELDVYVEAHVEAYDQAKRKWANCSMEEWNDGARELTVKFAKMLDFVKDHLASKLTLYASLHSSIAAHRAILSERDQTLQDARKSLIREGENVVGGNLSCMFMEKKKDNTEQS